MKANQLDLRAAFFMFFTRDAKSNRKYLLILLFSGLDGRKTLFIALLAWCRLFPDAFRTAGVQCIDPRGGSLKMNSTPIATMPIAVPTMPVNRVAGASGWRYLRVTKKPITATDASIRVVVVPMMRPVPLVQPIFVRLTEVTVSFIAMY
jgi:hypothetical protein